MLDIYDSTGHLTISKQIKGSDFDYFLEGSKTFSSDFFFYYFDYLESHVHQISGQSLTVR